MDEAIYNPDDSGDSNMDDIIGNMSEDGNDRNMNDSSDDNENDNENDIIYVGGLQDKKEDIENKENMKKMQYYTKYNQMTQEQQKEIGENIFLVHIYDQLVKINNYDIQEFINLSECTERTGMKRLQRAVKRYGKYKNLPNEQQEVLLRSMYEEGENVLDLVNDFIQTYKENHNDGNWWKMLIYVKDLTYDYRNSCYYYDVCDGLCDAMDRELKEKEECQQKLENTKKLLNKENEMLQTKNSLLLEENEQLKQMILQLTRTDGMQ